jgi:hypothetical protein
MRLGIILLFFCFQLALHVPSFSQERCGTTEYEKSRNKNQQKESTDQFEKWMSSKLSRRSKIPFSVQATQTTYSIPVVVHIIHNGEPIGTGLNLSEAQINSQLKVLNDDFNRLNADQTNTPALFLPVAASFSVQFILAKQDPDGLPTNGIVRIRGSKSSWSSAENFAIKSQSYWPAEQYLNIWVIALTDFLGYAQFPVSNLAGLENSSNERVTDGIVVNYREFGSSADGNFDLAPRYNKGRTLTHEMGHFFGLRHIWGDETGCTGNDFVADTPTQSNSTSNCPVHPQPDCAATKMFQNFLDYTDDACMNLFTQGQVDRMLTIIQNSPRRKELTTSIGLQPPTSFTNDLGIKKIVAPGTTACSGILTPSILVRNYGTNSITNAQLQVKRNSITIETKNIVLSLAPDAEQQIDFLPITLGLQSTDQFEFKITFVNSVVDNNVVNNSKSISTTTPTESALPLTENFSVFPSGWKTNNPDDLTTWTTTTSNGTPSIYLNYYDYAEIGATDQLVSPQLDLTNTTTAVLTFDRAYAQYPGTTGENLTVAVSTGCRFDNSSAILFNKSDAALATVPNKTSRFVPIATDWKTQVISLSQFIGQKIQVAFVGTNANGNNLYIKNVKVLNSAFVDLALVKLETPSLISCINNPVTSIRVRNNGNVPTNSFDVAFSLNGNAQVKNVTSTLLPNEEVVVTLPTLLLNVGINSLSVAIQNINSGTDADASNNSNQYQIAFNNFAEVIPLREKFENQPNNAWTSITPTQQLSWTGAMTNYGNSLSYQSFTNSIIGQEAWLISPILDFSSAAKASVLFDVSYAKKINGSEVFRVLTSTDCGINFTDELLSESGIAIHAATSQTSWLPSLKADWTKKYLNLTELAGKQNVRLAFIITNDNGNNLYLDNIEFFASENPSPIEVASPYSIYGGLVSPLQITFNLAKRETVLVRVYNTMGQLISDATLNDVLNQTFPIEMPNQGQGIYIVTVQISGQLSTTKVYWGN